MSITDELREWAKTLTHWWYDPVKDEYTYTTGIMPPSIDAIRLDSNILTIADRIDANFKAACESEYAAGVMSVPIAVDESKWVKLPVDADGVPIRVGDVMDGNRGTVTCIRDAGHGWEIVTDHMYSYNPADLHHHELTVEDVLREFALACEDAGNSRPAVMRLAEEYAAKLQLKED